MWRWVTRCLIVAVVVALSVPASFAQEVSGDCTTGRCGALQFPNPGETQSGVMFFKGWFLDPAQVSKISVYVDDNFITNANTGLPRIDVEQAYPNYPGIHQTAPGFQIGVLASRFSNGPHTVEVRVQTSDGVSTPVGRRTLNVDNSLNQSPFGNLDIPDLSGTYDANGSFPVLGWAADTDGIARIDVYSDGAILQQAMYGDPRPDVGNTYPDFPAALFSGFIANIDSTRLKDGLHLLEIKAVDRLGLSRLLGRRQIQVFNSETTLRPFGTLDEPKRDAIVYGTLCGTPPGQVSPPVRPQAHITPVRGWALDLGTRDDVGRISYVELLVDGVPLITTDNCGFIFGQYANCYGLPRFDVQRYYPNYPDAPRSGYMFTLDVGALFALPAGFAYKPGNHTLKVRVGDNFGTVSELPGPAGIPVFFTCADTDTLFAGIFGFIDIPTSFDYVKGVVAFQGWALSETAAITQIEIYVDGNFIGVAQMNIARPDVAAQYPFILNAVNSGWRFNMDTSKLGNGAHRLTVRGLSGTKPSEIGSVDFYTQNPNLVPKGLAKTNN
jgi:N-acetylmuramoyl-L-alanine amidase